jgi:hypothetical protein
MINDTILLDIESGVQLGANVTLATMQAEFHRIVKTEAVSYIYLPIYHIITVFTYK